jgi:hypothetical protein
MVDTGQRRAYNEPGAKENGSDGPAHVPRRSTFPAAQSRRSGGVGRLQNDRRQMDCARSTAILLKLARSSGAAIVTDA